jgi:caa(3)-type oxidase subunit IV
MDHSVKSKAPGKPFPDETDYHGHPGYGKIFLALIVLMAASLVVGYFTSAMAGITLIFLLAIVKAFLVVANFMHLKFEPVLVFVVVLVVVFILFSFFFGVFPDIIPVERNIVR